MGIEEPEIAETSSSAERAKLVVRRYYDDLWNKWDLSLADELISDDVTFEGSLGVSVSGREGFLDYVRLVRAAFPDFHNKIEEMIGEGERVVARLTYSGTHEGDLLGIAATGKRVTYSGAAFFRVANGRIAEGWVLGDRKGLMDQLTLGADRGPTA